MEPIPHRNFKDFILRNPRNKRYLLIAVASIVLQFIIFKSFYPFADFFSDSYSYIEGAQMNLEVNIWPIGYSKFLLAVHYLTSSDTVVVALQYFLLEAAALYFFFTIGYFFEPGKKSRNILFVFLFFNPLFLYLSNYINSDPLFAALSLLWFAQLLWVIWRPKLSQLFFHGIILFLAFTVRNNAYYYPVISAISFIVSNQKTWRKLLGIAFPLVLIFVFVEHTKQAAYKMTGIRQFSLFTGWQLANNALYGFPGMWIDSTNLPTKESKELYRLSKAFYADVPKDFNSHILRDNIGNFFIVYPYAPLKQYMEMHYKMNNNYDVIVAWGKASAAFAPYGNYLLRKHPFAFVQYFMLINTKNYFIPPLEKLERYNLGRDDVPAGVQQWFDYPTPNVSAVSKTAQGSILIWVPTVFLLLNIYFIGTLVWYLFFRGHKTTTASFNKSVLLFSAFILINAAFSIIAAMIVFRYEFFPMMILLTTSLLVLEKVDKKKLNKKEGKAKLFPKLQGELVTPKVNHV